MLPPVTSADPRRFDNSTGGRAPAVSHDRTPLLVVDDLTAGFTQPDGRFLPAVNGVSLTLRPGETLALVGESGSGKSMTALAIMRLLEPPASIRGGRVTLQGTDLLSLGERAMRSVRGAGIGLVFQEPMSALNPVMTIGDHVAEALVVHKRAGWRDARERAVKLLEAVRIPDARRRAGDYPHQLSGGMRQRVMIAIALACEPPLLIADEPTTALDVTIQADILDLLKELRERYPLAILLITHDLGVVAQTADHVAVMYSGRIVEQAPVTSLFHAPRHPYTQGLLASIPGAAGGARLHAIDGIVPALGDVPPGCPFEPRCGARLPVCASEMPGATAVDPNHVTRCHLYGSGHA